MGLLKSTNPVLTLPMAAELVAFIVLLSVGFQGYPRAEERGMGLGYA